MTQILTQLNIGDMITLDDPKVYDFTEKEDFVVQNISSYETELGNIIFLDIDDYFIIGHDLSGTLKIFICELYKENYDNYFHRGQFISQIKVEHGSGNIIYNLVNETLDIESEVKFGEYQSNSYLTFILVRYHTTSEVFRGFEFAEENLIM